MGYSSGRPSAVLSAWVRQEGVRIPPAWVACLMELMVLALRL